MLSWGTELHASHVGTLPCRALGMGKTEPGASVSPGLRAEGLGSDGFAIWSKQPKDWVPVSVY